jgi:hypothetical protein
VKSYEQVRLLLRLEEHSSNLLYMPRWSAAIGVDGYVSPEHLVPILLPSSRGGKKAFREEGWYTARLTWQLVFGAHFRSPDALLQLGLLIS